MKHTKQFTYNFICRESKANKMGLAPLELVYTFDGIRKYFSTPFRYNPNDFDVMIRTGQIPFVSSFNTFINSNPNATFDEVSRYIRFGSTAPSLDYVVKEYLKVLSKRVEDGVLSLGVWKKYKMVYDDALMLYGSDKTIDQFNRRDCERILTLWKSRNYEQATIFGRFRRFKSLFIFAIEREYIESNPCNNIKCASGVKDSQFLTIEQIKMIKEHNFNDRLNHIRDLFIFCCFTGLSYCDLASLTKDDIKEDGNDKYIIKCRKKTGVKFVIYIVPQALEILEKYNYELPKISNQKMNGYLFEIEQILGLPVHLHCHISRHSYACLLLNNNISIEVVSRSLGHSSTTMSRHYAKLLDTTALSALKQMGSLL